MCECTPCPGCCVRGASGLLHITSLAVIRVPFDKGIVVSPARLAVACWFVDNASQCGLLIACSPTMHKAFLHCLQATHNSFIWLPNGIGAGLGLLQLGLCLIFKQKARYAYGICTCATMHCSAGKSEQLCRSEFQQQHATKPKAGTYSILTCMSCTRGMELST